MQWPSLKESLFKHWANWRRIYTFPLTILRNQDGCFMQRYEELFHQCQFLSLEVQFWS